jgi:hypothetical protein
MSWSKDTPIHHCGNLNATPKFMRKNGFASKYKGVSMDARLSDCSK